MSLLAGRILVEAVSLQQPRFRRSLSTSSSVESAGNASDPSYEFAEYPGGWDYLAGSEEEPSYEVACSPWLHDFLTFSRQYYIPFICLLGLVGNILSCAVFLNSHLKLRSSSYYLAALATADSGFLFSLLLVWFNNSLGWRVFNRPVLCEAVVYVSSVCGSLSVWLIVAFTVERFIAIQYPLHRPQMCTITRAKAVVLGLLALAMLCHSYSLVTAGVVRYSDGMEVCDMRREYLEAMRIISIVDSIISLLAPLVLIVVMNTMIMRNLLKFHRRFRQSSGGEAHHQPQQRRPCGVQPRAHHSNINLSQIPDFCRTNDAMLGLTLSSGIAGQRQLSQQPFRWDVSTIFNRRPPSPIFQSSSLMVIPPNAHSVCQITGCSASPAVSSSRLAVNGCASTSQVSLRENDLMHQPGCEQSRQPKPATSVVIPAPRNTTYQLSDFDGTCIHVKTPSRQLISMRGQQNITKMLLLISTVFILLNLPSYVIRLCVFFFTLARKNEPVMLGCLQQFFMLLYYTNFSINFLLYAMCGITFRRCLEQLVRKALKNLSRSRCNPFRCT